MNNDSTSATQLFARTDSSTEQPLSFEQPRQVLFDLSLYGHHPAYIRHLILYWQRQELSGMLCIVTLPEFLRVHADVVSLVETDKSISFIPIQVAEAKRLRDRSSGVNRNLRKLQEWQLFQKYARSLHADHCLMLYLDTCLLPLALGMSFPCAFSGIYFRPTLHYASFQASEADENSLRATLHLWREQFFTKRMLSHPQLHTLFSLDSLAVEGLRQLHPWMNMVSLPDPVDTEAGSGDVASLKTALGIEDGRQVFLLFGAITSRKGIFKLIEAIAHIPIEQCQQLCIALVGEANAAVQTKLRSEIATVQKMRPVQFVVNFEYVDEAQVPSYFQLADVVLAPYQRHVGMSGILLQAAAAQKPVLSSDYGLMGEMTRQHQLGVVVDSIQAKAVANGLLQFLAQPAKTLYSPHLAAEFAAANSSERFAQVIWSELTNV